MRVAGVIAVSALVASLSLLTLTPRLGHTFPSMVDDWYVIEHVPGQVVDALTLRIPEDERYRPGWTVWSALQWHTLGAPNDLSAPLVWWLLRVLALAAGIVAAARSLRGRAPPTRAGRVAWLALAGGAALVVVTIPGFAVDLARYGPQEPLMVGLMCGGGAVLAASIDRALNGALQRHTACRLRRARGLGVRRRSHAEGDLHLHSCARSVPLDGDGRRATNPRPPTTTDATDGLDHSRDRRTAPRADDGADRPAHAGPIRFYDATPGEGLIAKTQGLFDRMDTVLGSHAPGILLAAAVVLLIVLTARRRSRSSPPASS